MLRSPLEHSIFIPRKHSIHCSHPHPFPQTNRQLSCHPKSKLACNHAHAKQNCYHNAHSDTFARTPQNPIQIKTSPGVNASEGRKFAERTNSFLN